MGGAATSLVASSVLRALFPSWLVRVPSAVGFLLDDIVFYSEGATGVTICASMLIDVSCIVEEMWWYGTIAGRFDSKSAISIFDSNRLS